MSRKRRNTSSPEPGDLPSPKRRYSRDRHSDSDSDEEDDGEVPYIDEYSGQTGAFPGLGVDSGEPFYGPASDGLDYLRMVRSEAKTVPHILTASDSESRLATTEERTAEEGGYFHDGTYTAAAGPTTDPDSYPLAQQCYYDSLLAHFRLVRATLKCAPPLSHVERLHPSQFVSFPESSRQVRSQWEKHIISANPHPVQLACMDSHTVLELVRFLKESLTTILRHRDDVVTSRVCAWVWAILGKCRDRGELSSDDIADIRELAQRAIQLQEQRDAAGTMADEDEELDDPFAEEEADELMNVGKNGIDPTVEDAVLLEKGPDKVCIGRSMISMMLDMIVTVAGEVYGQRDLLKSRTKWPVSVSAD